MKVTVIFVEVDKDRQFLWITNAPQSKVLKALTKRFDEVESIFSYGEWITDLGYGEHVDNIYVQSELHDSEIVLRTVDVKSLDEVIEEILDVIV